MKRFLKKCTVLLILLLIAALTAVGCQNQVEYDVRYLSDSGGTVTGVRSQRVRAGADATEVYAVANEGYRFDGWSDGVTAPARQDKNITAELKVTARFTAQSYIIRYVAGDRGDISGEAEQTVRHGESATSVVAVAKEGFRFVGWSDGVKTNMRADTNVTQSMTVSAIFNTDKVFTVKYVNASYGGIEGKKEQYVLDGDDAEIVTAIPYDGCVFTHWSDGLTTPTRQDKDVRKDTIYYAYFDRIFFSVKYHVNMGGRIQGGTDRVVQMNDIAWAQAIPDIEYEFVKWSDGLTSDTRNDKITSNFEVTAIFKRKEFSVSYNANPGGRVAGLTAQTVEYGGDSSSVTAIPDAGYEFLSWSDGVMTAMRQDMINRPFEVRATFAPIKGVTFKILMVFVTELSGDFERYDGEIIKVSYKMSPTEKQILELLSLKMAACLNDMFQGEVRFVLGNYFTTQPLGREHMTKGIEAGKIYTYGLRAKDIPEISDIWKSYGSTMITFGMNDYNDKLHCIAGRGGKQSGYVHLETILAPYINNGTDMGKLVDSKIANTHKMWETYMEVYLHEFAHTIQLFINAQDLHGVIIYYSNVNMIWGMEPIKLYLLNQAIVDGEIWGIPKSFWQKWSEENIKAYKIKA